MPGVPQRQDRKRDTKAGECVMAHPSRSCSTLRCPNLMPCPKHGYTVVTGPPCSGKTTYILEHMAEGDVMVDFDRIAQAISPNSPQYQYPEGVRLAVRAMRLAAIRHVEEGELDGRLWLIDTALRDHADVIARHRRMGAAVVELDPGIDVCLERAQRERPTEITNLIHEWYAGGPDGITTGSETRERVANAS